MSLVTLLFGWLLTQRYFQIPNGYDIDLDRDPPRFAAPCDRDNIVAVPVPTGRWLGDGVVSFRYDAEERHFGTDADVLSLRMKWEF